MSEPGDTPPPDPTIEWSEIPLEPDPDDPAAGGLARPWYKRPGPLVAALLGAIVLLGLAGLLFLDTGDDGGPSTVNIFRVERTDGFGDPLVRELTVEVIGESGSVDGFVWLIPPGTRAPQPASAATSGSAGRAEFQWGPTNDDPDPEQWMSDIVMTEVFGAQESLATDEFECTYERRGAPAQPAVLKVSFDDGGDLHAPRTAVYHFLGYRFQAGDVTTCAIASGSSVAGGTSVEGTPIGEPELEPADPTVPGETTLPTETTSPTATTEPGSTQPGTTEPGSTQPGTTQPGTTQPGTTQPGTTQPVTTPPQGSRSLMDVIDSRAELSALGDLIDYAGLRATFTDLTATLTLFAPDNAALIDQGLVAEDLEDADRPFIRDLLLTHLHRGDAYLSPELLSLTEVTVEFAGPYEIDAEFEPPTIDFVDIIVLDITADNGVLHELNDVIFPSPD